MGAVASGGVRVQNREVIVALAIRQETIDAAIAGELPELERREREYRAGRPALEVEGQVAILVDDGLATGSSMQVAASALKKKSPGQIVVAVPVAAPATCLELTSEVDRVVCAATP